MSKKSVIQVRGLDIGYNGMAIMENLNFDIYQGEIFIILGGSGCGKSTLLKHLIGLYRPMRGDIFINDQSMVSSSEKERKEIMKTFGVLYQSGALFGSLTLEENITLVLEEHAGMSKQESKRSASKKLALVDLQGFNDYYPAAISGGMKKRAGLARAMALSPNLLFFDEPSAGLDPISAANLDRLILKLSRDLNTTMVIVTHELDSIFAIADRAIILDKETRSIIEEGRPEDLQNNSQNEWVKRFLNRDGLRRS
ncbi:MAG: ATP-binding cassette domain-containing protein [Lentisphaeraceae bacterium]|nr:ATP-binding cassette domain-containing protein [Lentisphaeraceae bacterium]